jgi:uncharacterized protein with HEPN domain
MARDDRDHLNDIADAARLLAIYAEHRSSDLRDWQAKLLLAGVERQFEIIGEAVKRLSDAIKVKHPSVPWSDFARFRDVLAHQYHRIEPMNVEAAVDVHLPRLLAVIEAELSNGAEKCPTLSSAWPRRPTSPR